MATWGKRKVKINNHSPESTMYYEYSATSDQYYIEIIINEDFGLGNERFESEFRCGPDVGEAMMEAFINHVLAYQCSGDVDRFVERYITSNRFSKAKVEE